MQGAPDSVDRRTPKQPRALARRDALLAAAADLIAEAGYRGANMTEIARRAGASIGALYDYFPDKAALAKALVAKYTQEADAFWVELFKKSEYVTANDLAQVLVDGILLFVEEHPGYAALLGAPLDYARSEAARRQLRSVFAKTINKLQPSMSRQQALLCARIVIELLKALLSVRVQVNTTEGNTVTEQFRTLIAFHIAGGKQR